MKKGFCTSIADNDYQRLQMGFLYDLMISDRNVQDKIMKDFVAITHFSPALRRASARLFPTPGK